MEFRRLLFRSWRDDGEFVIDALQDGETWTTIVSMKPKGKRKPDLYQRGGYPTENIALLQARYRVEDYFIDNKLEDWQATEEFQAIFSLDIAD